MFCLDLARAPGVEEQKHTVSLSNAALARYGVSRETKRRALAKLEAAGLIKVERRPGRATIVTLLNT